MLTLFVDGGCSGNSQKDISKRTMVSVVTDESGNVLREIQNHGGSNAIAEFIAIEHAIEEALERKEKELHIISDSKTAIAWTERDDATKLKPKMLAKMNDPEWYQAIKGRVDQLKKYLYLTIEWAPREENLAGHYIEEKYAL